MLELDRSKLSNYLPMDTDFTFLTDLNLQQNRCENLKYLIEIFQ